MKASETNLLKFLSGQKQFLVPIYQRKYSWTLTQCQQLWEDIVQAGKDDSVKGHFIGSIVYIEKGLYRVSQIPQLLVIDGQQRLTTLSLLLLAFRKKLAESSVEIETTEKKIKNYYLVNNEEEGDLFYKLLLTETDRDTFISLIDEVDLPTDFSKRVQTNYEFFLNEIEKSSLSLKEIYEGISKLLVVDIALDREHDNPQLIFESLNSTGLDLSQSDLIRNYVLMKLEPKEQAMLYKKYWKPLETNFGNGTAASLFDRFMRDYLTIKFEGRIPKIGHVYDEFKEYLRKNPELTIENAVADIYRYAKWFSKIENADGDDSEVKNALKDINTLKVDVAYPLLMEVYDDFESDIISKEELLSIIRLVEAYVFRRAIVGIPTNSLNKTFATISKEIDKENYWESLKAAFLNLDSYKRFPSDEEFFRELLVKDVYNFRSRNYLLRKLTNKDTKEIVDIEAYTIEHIMPQNKNMSDHWKSDIGPNWEEVYANSLHVLGNLTLTRYNSELSDRPFLEKRDMAGGFKESPVRLNKELRELETWNGDTITARSQRLAKEASEVWPFPLVSEYTKEKMKEKIRSKEQAFSLEDHPNLTGEMLLLFNELRKQICNLNSSVKEEFKQEYILYKTDSRFAIIVPQKSELKIVLNMLIQDLVDPEEKCIDVAGKWATGDTVTAISTVEDMEYTMDLIKQSFEANTEA